MTIPLDFTPHDGGPCPVHPETVVELKTIDQTILGLGNPRANCFQACLAMVLGRPLSDCLDITDPTIDDNWVDHLQQWADGIGWQMRSGLKAPADIPYIANGPTENREGVHGVVCVNGKMFHDPHPSRDGLVSINYYLWFQPYAEPTDWEAVAGKLADALREVQEYENDLLNGHEKFEAVQEVARKALTEYNAAKK